MKLGTFAKASVLVSVIIAVLGFVFDQVLGQSTSSRVVNHYSVVKVNSPAGKEYRCMYSPTGLLADRQHFFSVIAKAGAVAERPHPDISETNGWSRSCYGQLFFPGAVLHGAAVSIPTVGKNGITVRIAGAISVGANKSAGSFTRIMVYTYDSSAKKVMGTGTCVANLSKSPSALGLGDLNLYKLASNFLHDVPLLGGGVGDTGDMSEVNVVSGSTSYKWDLLANPGYFPTNTADSLLINVIGQYNNVDTAAQGYAPIVAAYKPNVSIKYTSKVSGVPMIFGAIYDIANGTKFWLDNVGITPLILRTSTAKKYSFDVVFESTAYAITRYTIAASSGSNGSVSPSGTVSINSGNSQTFAITPATGYQVISVLVDGASVGAVTSYTFTNVTTNHTISAVFAIKTYAITASAGSNGSVSPSGTVSVNYGASQTFAITPAMGYQVSSVLVDGASIGAVTSYTFSNVTTNHTIAATFAIKTYTIAASAGSNGSVSPSGTVSVNYGASQTFTVTPAVGYNISSVLVDGASIGAVTSYTFSNVTTNHTIAATFAIKTFTINASSGNNGSVTPSGAVLVDYGGNQSFSIIASNGYQIEDVLVDGWSAGAISSYTFSNVTDNYNYTIAASFVKVVGLQWEAISCPTNFAEIVCLSNTVFCLNPWGWTSSNDLKIGGIWKSEDMGNSWTSISPEMTYPSGTPYKLDRFSGMSVDSGKLYVGSAQGLIVSTNMGKSFYYSFQWGWDPVTDVDFHNGYGWMTISSWGGMSGVSNIDSNGNWVNTYWDSGYRVVADPIDPKNIAYAAGASWGYVRTMDGGNTWTNCASLVNFATVLDGTAVAFGNNYIKMVSNQWVEAVGDFISKDHGETWQSAGFKTSDIIASYVKDESSGLLFAGGDRRSSSYPYPITPILYVGLPGKWTLCTLPSNSAESVKSLAIMGGKIFMTLDDGTMYRANITNVVSQLSP